MEMRLIHNRVLAQGENRTIQIPLEFEICSVFSCSHRGNEGMKVTGPTGKLPS